MNEFIDIQQKIDNLLDVELVDIDDINCCCQLCPIMMIVSLSFLIEWTLNNAFKTLRTVNYTHNLLDNDEVVVWIHLTEDVVLVLHHACWQQMVGFVLEDVI